MMIIENPNSLTRSYYCSMKFRYLKINMNGWNYYCCDAATPHPIDFEWLQKNPGRLFNTDINVVEREQMLANQRNASCEQNCWPAEDYGLESPRLRAQGQIITHTQTVSSPEIIDLTINNDCNLTCSYCCKEFSSAWKRDLTENGSYKIQNVVDARYQLTVQDRILNKITQNELHNSLRYQLLINEIKCYAPALKQLIITGGEPLLDNQLVETLMSLNLNQDCKINLFTGMGVNIKRFERVISQLSTTKNLHVTVSAENIGSFLEFNRYGTTWNDFQAKIHILDRYVDWSFHCAISNLTIFGFAEFANFFKNRKMKLTFAHQPKIMSPFVLDAESKKLVLDQIKNLDRDIRDKIQNHISKDPGNELRLGIGDFLRQFVDRRPNLDLNIFPKSFLQWLEFDHVV